MGSEEVEANETGYLVSSSTANDLRTYIHSSYLT